MAARKVTYRRRWFSLGYGMSWLPMKRWEWMWFAGSALYGLGLVVAVAGSTLSPALLLLLAGFAFVIVGLVPIDGRRQPQSRVFLLCGELWVVGTLVGLALQPFVATR